MGSRRDCTWILGLSGFRVTMIEGESGEATAGTAGATRTALPVQWLRPSDAPRALDQFPNAASVASYLGLIPGRTRQASGPSTTTLYKLAYNRDPTLPSCVIDRQSNPGGPGP